MEGPKTKEEVRAKEWKRVENEGERAVKQKRGTGANAIGDGLAP